MIVQWVGDCIANYTSELETQYLIGSPDPILRTARCAPKTATFFTELTFSLLFIYLPLFLPCRVCIQGVVMITLYILFTPSVQSCSQHSTFCLMESVILFSICKWFCVSYIFMCTVSTCFIYHCTMQMEIITFHSHCPMPIHQCL